MQNKVQERQSKASEWTRCPNRVWTVTPTRFLTEIQDNKCKQKFCEGLSLFSTGALRFKADETTKWRTKCNQNTPNSVLMMLWCFFWYSCRGWCSKTELRCYLEGIRGVLKSKMQEKISRGITPISNWDASVEGWRNHTENSKYNAKDANEGAGCFLGMSGICTECY